MPSTSIDQIRAWHERVLLYWPRLVDAHGREAQAHQCIALLLRLVPPGAELPQAAQVALVDTLDVPGALSPGVSIAALNPEVGHSDGSSRRRFVRTRATGGPGAHTCHGGCGKVVSPAMWGCLSCWRRLPQSFRNRIWQHYRPGQEIDKRPSMEYLAVAREIEQYIRENWAERKAP